MKFEMPMLPVIMLSVMSLSERMVMIEGMSILDIILSPVRPMVTIPLISNHHGTVKR